MDEQQAEAVAAALGGTAWNSGGGLYLVRIERSDGHFVVVSDEVVCEYEDDDAFEAGRATRSIILH